MPIHHALRLSAVLLFLGAVLTGLAGLQAMNTDADQMTLLHSGGLATLRLGFLVATLVLAFAVRPRPVWRRTTNAARLVVMATFVGVALDVGATWGLWGDPTAMLGATDDIHRRLFRLAYMASRAIPTMALLAAASARLDEPQDNNNHDGNRFSNMLIRSEPWLWLIGTLTLATLLALAAFVHKEITWLLPLGADTSLLGAVAAALRARRRHDGAAGLGWSVIVASMGAGLLMGTYSFGGPLPTPDIVGDYTHVHRMWLRDAHIAAMAVGAALVCFAAARPMAPSSAASSGATR